MSKLSEQAEALVNGPRQLDYGHPFHDFTVIARMWAGYLNLHPDSLQPEDVALMMEMVKMSRLRNTPGHEDSQIDIHGYQITYEKIRDYRGMTGQAHPKEVSTTLSATIDSPKQSQILVKR